MKTMSVWSFCAKQNFLSNFLSFPPVDFAGSIVVTKHESQANRSNVICIPVHGRHTETCWKGRGCSSRHFINKRRIYLRKPRIHIILSERLLYSEFCCQGCLSCRFYFGGGGVEGGLEDMIFVPNRRNVGVIMGSYPNALIWCKIISDITERCQWRALRHHGARHGGDQHHTEAQVFGKFRPNSCRNDI